MLLQLLNWYKHTPRPDLAPKASFSTATMETLPLNRIGISDNTWSSSPVADDDSERTGSILSSSVNLAACAFGASMLSLPYAMSIAGPVVALVSLVLFGVLAFIAAQAILRAGIASEQSTYSSIVRHYFGDFQGLLTDILLSVALIVAAISYVVGLSDLLPVRLYPFASFSFSKCVL